MISNSEGQGQFRLVMSIRSKFLEEMFRDLAIPNIAFFLAFYTISISVGKPDAIMRGLICVKIITHAEYQYDINQSFFK